MFQVKSHYWHQDIKTSQNIRAGNFALRSVLLTSFTPITWKIQLSNVLISLMRQKINGLLHLIYWKGVASFLQQSESKVQENWGNQRLPFAFNWKLLHLNMNDILKIGLNWPLWADWKPLNTSDFFCEKKIIVSTDMIE